MVRIDTKKTLHHICRKNVLRYQMNWTRTNELETKWATAYRASRTYADCVTQKEISNLNNRTISCTSNMICAAVCVEILRF
jgi:hypothetical protein